MPALIKPNTKYQNKKWLARAIANGTTFKAIAEYCGVHESTISTWVTKFNLALSERQWDRKISESQMFLAADWRKEGLSYRDIGERLGIAEKNAGKLFDSTHRRKTISAGQAACLRVGYPDHPTPPYENPEWMEKAFANKMSYRQIAMVCGILGYPISHEWIRMQGVSFNLEPSEDKKMYAYQQYDWYNPAKIVKLYTDEMMSAYQIASHIKSQGYVDPCTRHLVEKVLKQENVHLRNNQYAIRLRRPWTDKEWLENQLKDKSMFRVAKENNISASTVGQWARKFDLFKPNRPDYQDQEVLKEMMKSQSIPQIANQFAVSPETIRRWAVRHKLV